MVNWSLGLSRCLTLVLFLTILIPTLDFMDGANDWSSSETFGIMGINVELYFSPEPGIIDMELEEVKGIINITRQNNDYNLIVGVVAYGSIQDNVTIFNNTAVHEIRFSFSLNSYREEIPLKTPENGSFISYMVIVFLWQDSETLLLESFNKTVRLAADYEKRYSGFDIASIVIPGGFVIFIAGTLVIASLSLKKYRSESNDLKSINEKAEQIISSSRNYFTGGGKFKDLDLSEMSSKPNPGEINLLIQRKRKQQKNLVKLKPKLEVLNRINIRLEKAREPVENNNLFKFISSFFIRASRKREIFPPGDEVGERVRKIRDELKEGKWGEMLDVENIKIMWFICDKYVKTAGIHRELPLGDDFDIIKESIILNHNIKRFYEIQNNIHWPTDRNLVLKTEENILTEIETIKRLLNDFNNLDKKTKKEYHKECSNLLIETEKNLKWLESVEDEIDENLTGRLKIRLQRLNELMTQELDLISKVNKKSTLDEI